MGVRAEERGERRAEDHAIEQQMEAYDRRVFEPGLRLAEQPRTLLRRRCYDDRIGVQVLEVVDAHARLDGHAGVFERAPRRVAVHCTERPRGQHEIGVVARTEQRGANGEQSGVRIGLVRAEIQRRPDEHVPEAFDRTRGGAESPQQRAERLAFARLRTAAARRDDRNQQPLAQGQMRVGDQRRQAGPDRRVRAVLADHRQSERPPQVRPALADPLEKLEVLRKTAERDVLAVVGRRNRIAFAFRQRLHRSSQCRPRLEQRDVVARIHELERGGAAGEPAADDDGLHRRQPSPTIRSFASAERCVGPAKTSKPEASIRSSVAR